MTSPLEDSFQNFRTSGSPEALAEVYDAVAPHLLRLAMHLAVDAAAAEDLVQATFVTAIEKADDFEDGRPLRPWLVGILTNHARNAQRKRRTALPGESAMPEPAAAGSDPLAGLKTAEFDAALDEAIDRIPEAYRPVLVLRLKHGMQTPEIAHALRRPAGTVRTQLVRGLEKLRDVLPAGLATGLALWAVPTRGLAAVREAVLTHATSKTAAATAGGLTVITSVVLMKKILTGVAALLIATALTWTLWSDPEPRRGDPGLFGGDPRTATATRGNEGDPRAASAGTGDRVEVERPAAVDEGPAWQLTGRVETRPDVPIDGAVLEVHRGSPTDQRTSLASIMEMTAKLDATRSSSLLLKVDGEPLLRVPVAADGSFAVPDLNTRHLRLVLRHRYYALTEAVPVHAHPDATTFDAGDLPTYCGGQIIGRVLGDTPPEGARISYSADPDPMLVLRDARAFLSHSLRGGGEDTLLGEDGRFEFTAVPPAPQVAVELHSDTHQGSAPALPLGAGETREVVVVLREAASMAVRVTDAVTGEPLEGADVRTLPLSVQGQFRLSRATRYAATDTDGRARVGGLEADTFRISVQATDYLAASQDVVVAAGRQAEVSVALDKGPVIRGRVVDTAGEPLADAGIALIPKLEIPMVGDLSSFAGGSIASIAGRKSKVRSADDGSFAIGAPQRDTAWNVVAHCEGYVLGEPVPVTSFDEPVEIVMQRPGRVLGRVLDGTQPAKQFTARTVTTVFMMFERPTALVEIQGSEDGRFVLENVEPGTVTFRAESMFGGSFERPVTVEAGQEIDLGDLVLQAPCRVAGKVVDADGVPVQGATVTRSVGGMMDHPMLAMFFDNRSTRTRADGTFELTRVEPGVFAVQAHAEGHASGKSGRLRLESGESLDDLEVQLGRGGTVEGRLLLAPGMVLRDWQILATQEPQQNTLVTDPDESGAFRFENLDPGRYQIQAMDVRNMARMNTDLIRDLPLGGMPDIGKVMREMQDNVIIERARVQDGEVTTVELDGTDFEALGTTLRVTASTGGGASLQNGFVEVSIRDHEGGEAVRIAILEDGRLELDGIEPGVVQLQLRSGITMSPFGDPLLVEIDGKEEVVERTWELPGGEIAGQILDDETGEPILGAVVRLIPEGRSREGQDRDPGFALSDRAGRFSFGGLQPGRYTILVDDQFAARGGDATARREAIEVAQGQPVEGLVLRARRGAGLEVQVLNAMGQPVPRARLLVVDPNGTPLGSLAVTATNSAGEGWMSGLPNGKARVVAWAEGLAPNVSELRDLDTDTRTRISITLEQGTEVQARVLDARGEPLTGASVALRFAEGPWIPTALLGRIPGPDGTLDLGQLPPGPVRFAVTHPSARYEAERSVPRGNRTSLAIHP